MVEVLRRPSGDRPTLLLIDDCVLQRDMYEIALERDFTILTAGRGEDGLRVATDRRPDAIVLDVKMPGLSGWVTCLRLKCDESTADIPVVLLTGTDGVDLSDHATAVGASALLKKPCSAEMLKRTVVGLLRSTMEYSARIGAA